MADPRAVLAAWWARTPGERKEALYYARKTLDEYYSFGGVLALDVMRAIDDGSLVVLAREDAEAIAASPTAALGRSRLVAYEALAAALEVPRGR